MIDPMHPVPITKQCEILGLSRSSVYYRKAPADPADLELMMVIDWVHLEWPFLGSRKILKELRKWGFDVGRDKVVGLMRRMGIRALYQKPRTSIPTPFSKVYPYLLKNLKIIRPNQVWMTDITYIPMDRGFAYLIAIIDVWSRKVLAWRLSNTQDAQFCVDALELAIQQFGPPEIFNTDQGSQFTSTTFTGVLHAHGTKISMDGKGRWIDNVFIERLWRSVKYEEVFLKAYDSMSHAKDSLANYFHFYNTRRAHQSLDYKTPDDVYYGTSQVLEAA